MQAAQLESLKELLTEASRNVPLSGSFGSENRAVAEWKAAKLPGVVSVAAFELPRKLIHVTLKTQEFHALLLWGEGGLGKTVLVTNEVRQLVGPEEWDYVSGYSTPLALYETLFFARDKKLLVLDDVEGIFGSPVGIAILKGALWDIGGRRIVQYASKSDKVGAVPSEFEFKAQIIILCNKIPNPHDASVNALLSRAVPFEVSLSYEEKLDVLGQLIDSRKDLSKAQKEQCKALIRDETNRATKNLNFRLLRKIVAFVKEDAANAQTLLRVTLEVDEYKTIVLELMQSGLPVEQQVLQFRLRTDKSRRTYFRIKDQLKNAKVPNAKDTAHGTKRTNGRSEMNEAKTGSITSEGHGVAQEPAQQPAPAQVGAEVHGEPPA